jgi:Ca2+-binding EF-hand superfamily protein
MTKVTGRGGRGALFQMNVKLFYLTGLSIALLTAAVPAIAATDIDYDGDGLISEEEFRNHAAKEAASADSNGNGILDKSEYALTNAEAAAIDTNKDGAIQLAEFQASLMQAFKRMDENGDGRLDAAERRAK